MKQSYEKFRFAFGETVTKIYSDMLLASPGVKWFDLYSNAGVGKTQFSSWRSGTTVPSFAAALAFFDACGYTFNLIKK